MADGFKHITVTSADDDEVIVAGTATAAKAEGATAAEGMAKAPAMQPTPSRASGAAPSRSATRQAPAKSSQAPRPDKRGAYSEPTLADLEGEKMPLAQRIVIVAAIICIIGALVYYFVAMR